MKRSPFIVGILVVQDETKPRESREEDREGRYTRSVLLDFETLNSSIIVTIIIVARLNSIISIYH